MSVKHHPDLNTVPLTLPYRVLRDLLTLWAYVIALPGMNLVFRYTFLGGCGYILRLKAKGRKSEALAFIVERLSSNAYRQKEIFRWWHLMRLGMGIAQDYQLQSNLHLPLVEQLMRLVLTGPNPRLGYDAAYSLIGLSLWAFQVGDIKLSIFSTEQAIYADPMWGYPHYLLGWYGLFDSSVDSVTHFEQALKCNWSFFHRVLNDPVCQRHPDVISRLKKRVLVAQPSDVKRPGGQI